MSQWKQIHSVQVRRTIEGLVREIRKRLDEEISKANASWSGTSWTKDEISIEIKSRMDEGNFIATIVPSALLAERWGISRITYALVRKPESSFLTIQWRDWRAPRMQVRIGGLSNYIYWDEAQYL